MTDKPIEVVFLPGAFDSFDGTQEELDELIAEIRAKVADGSIFEESEDIDPEDLSPELKARFEQACKEFDDFKEGKDLKKRLN